MSNAQTILPAYQRNNNNDNTFLRHDNTNLKKEKSKIERINTQHALNSEHTRPSSI